MCRSRFYKAPNTPLRKADHLSWIKKMNLNSCVNYAHFRKSGHIYRQHRQYLLPVSYIRVEVNILSLMASLHLALHTG